MGCLLSMLGYFFGWFPGVVIGGLIGAPIGADFLALIGGAITWLLSLEYASKNFPTR